MNSARTRRLSFVRALLALAMVLPAACGNEETTTTTGFERGPDVRLPFPLAVSIPEDTPLVLDFAAAATGISLGGLTLDPTLLAAAEWTATLVTAPSHGTVAVEGVVVTYVPEADYFGPDTGAVEVRVHDDAARSDLVFDAVVKVMMLPVNDPPVLAGASITPAAPTASTTLTAVAEGLTDVDSPATATTVLWQWWKNAAPIDGATGPTLAGGLSAGDAIVVVGTPFDGQAEGIPVTSPTVTIAP